jgi:hypothetical protein
MPESGKRFSFSVHLSILSVQLGLSEITSHSVVKNFEWNLEELVISLR